MAKTKNKPSPTPATTASESTPRPALPPGNTSPEKAELGKQVSDAVTGTVAGTVATVRSVLPVDRLPVYLAGGALVLAGLVDPPAAVAVALGYEALRRWNTASPRPVQTRTSALT